MKKLLLVTSLAVATAAALAQGTVNFKTKFSGIDAPVLDTDNATKLAGTSFDAELYWGTTAGSLAPFADSLCTFATIPAGYVTKGSLTLPVAAGSTVYLQMKAWNAANASYEAAQSAVGGKWGFSNVISLATGGVPDPVTGIPGMAANLTGLQGFSLQTTIVPEPSTIALALLGAAALLLRRRS